MKDKEWQALKGVVNDAIFFQSIFPTVLSSNSEITQENAHISL